MSRSPVAQRRTALRATDLQDNDDGSTLLFSCAAALVAGRSDRAGPRRRCADGSFAAQDPRRADGETRPATGGRALRGAHVPAARRRHRVAARGTRVAARAYLEAARDAGSPIRAAGNGDRVAARQRGACIRSRAAVDRARSGGGAPQAGGRGTSGGGQSGDRGAISRRTRARACGDGGGGAAAGRSIPRAQPGARLGAGQGGDAQTRAAWRKPYPEQCRRRSSPLRSLPTTRALPISIRPRSRCKRSIARSSRSPAGISRSAQGPRS